MRRFGVDVIAGDCEVHDPAEKHVIGVAGRGPSEVAEPSPDPDEGDAVERPGPEGRQRLALQHVDHALLRGWLAALETGLLP